MMQFPRHQNLEIDDHDRVNMKPEIDAGILELPKKQCLKDPGIGFGCGSWNCPNDLIIPPMALPLYRLDSSQVGEVMQER